jgi:hypothetical protein
MSTSVRRWHAGVIAVVVVLALGGVVAACGGEEEGSSPAPSSTPEPAASPSPSVSALSGDEAEIAGNWEAFFDGTTPAGRKVELLQNGEQFADVIEARADSPLSQSTTAKVSAVSITSDTEAAVTYSILMGGQVVLPDQSGNAVLENGLWKVGAESFQALLALEGATGAPSPGASP